MQLKASFQQMYLLLLFRRCVSLPSMSMTPMRRATGWC